MMISLCLFSVFTDFTTAGSSCSLVSSLTNNTEKDGITNNLYVKRWSTPIKEPEVELFLLPCFTIHSITLLRETNIFHQAMTKHWIVSLHVNYLGLFRQQQLPSPRLPPLRRPQEAPVTILPRVVQ